MVIRNIDYIVTEDNISPIAVQDGGVQGDNCSVTVSFDISALSISENDVVRIDTSTGDGNFFSSDHLTAINGKVKYVLPIEVSKSGGVARLHLIVTTFKDGVEKAVKYSYPAKIKFTKSSFGSSGYNEYHEGLSGLAKKCEEYAEKAENAAATVSTHNSDITAHPYILSEIENAKYGLERDLETHNKSSDAHSAKFGSLQATVSGMMSGMETQAERLNSLNDNMTQVEDAVTENCADITDIKALLGIDSDYNDVAGISVDFENKTFKRLCGAVGKSTETDFNVFDMYKGRKRCNVANDGTINAYYGDENYRDDGTNGQVMVYQPAFYYRVVPLKLEKNTDSGIGYHIRKANYYVSDTPKPGFKLHPAFYDENGNEVEYILFSAYEGSMYDVSAAEYVNDGTNADAAIESGDLLCSVGGVKPISGYKYKRALNKENAEAMAQNRGSGWHIETIKATMANMLLMMIEFGQLNSQKALGNGIIGVSDSVPYNCASLTGSTAALGNASGVAESTVNEVAGVQTTYTDDGKIAVSYRGIENPWGNIWKHIQGINIWGNGKMCGGQPYVSDSLSNFAENKHDGDYKGVGFTLPNSASDNINAFGYGKAEYDWLLMPSETGGTSALPVGDRSYSTVDLNGYRVARLGGCWTSGASAGAYCWNFVGAEGYRDRTIGCRLLFVPSAV